MSAFYTPSVEEFRLSARQEFSYLVTEFAFKERKAPFKYENPYSIFFRKARAFVHIEGGSYGISLAVSVGRVDLFGRVREDISLSILMSLRETELLEPRYPDKRGQLEDMKFAAVALRRCATDFLTGDFSELSQFLRIQAEHQRAGQEEYEKTEMARTFLQASDAFHSGELELVVRLLEPHSSRLGKAQQAMLNLAKKRIARSK